MKTVIVGVTGGIAAYKSCEVVSRFRRLGYDVRVVMTKNATEFVTPLTFESLSKNKVVVDTFEKNREFEIEHISYAELASAFVIAPATANFIGKLAAGIADDMLTTTVMATLQPVFICPAMNVNMYQNPITQANIERLKERGYRFIGPDSGMLACGVTGAGRMSEPVEIVTEVDKFLTPKADLRGKTVLVTAGGTREPIDGVRFITNRSSGKMGTAIAEAALQRGARVILLYGTISVPVPKGVEAVKIETTMDMYREVMARTDGTDIFVMSAAPGDYAVENYTPHKIKADSLELKLKKNPDIAAAALEALSRLDGKRRVAQGDSNPIGNQEIRRESPEYRQNHWESHDLSRDRGHAHFPEEPGQAASGTPDFHQPRIDQGQSCHRQVRQQEPQVVQHVRVHPEQDQSRDCQRTHQRSPFPQALSQTDESEHAGGPCYRGAKPRQQGVTPDRA